MVAVATRALCCLGAVVAALVVGGTSEWPCAGARCAVVAPAARPARGSRGVSLATRPGVVASLRWSGSCAMVAGDGQGMTGVVPVIVGRFWYHGCSVHHRRRVALGRFRYARRRPRYRSRRWRSPRLSLTGAGTGASRACARERPGLVRHRRCSRPGRSPGLYVHGPCRSGSRGACGPSGPGMGACHRRSWR